MGRPGTRAIRESGDLPQTTQPIFGWKVGWFFLAPAFLLIRGNFPLSGARAGNGGNGMIGSLFLSAFVFLSLNLASEAQENLAPDAGKKQELKDRYRMRQKMLLS